MRDFAQLELVERMDGCEVWLVNVESIGDRVQLSYASNRTLAFLDATRALRKIQSELDVLMTRED